MRLVADIIRGQQVSIALNFLKFDAKFASNILEKVLLSAIANWQLKNEKVNIEEADLYVKEIYVDSARMLKRLRTAPQGRAHRIRKRSHHLVVTVDDRNVSVDNKNETKKTNQWDKSKPNKFKTWIIKGWDSNWYGGKSFSENIAEDHNIRKYLLARITKGGITKWL